MMGTCYSYIINMQNTTNFNGLLCNKILGQCFNKKCLKSVFARPIQQKNDLVFHHSLQKQI